MPTMARAMDTGDDPVLAAMDDAIFDASWDDGFALRLQHLLDGIAADVTSRETAANNRP